MLIGIPGGAQAGFVVLDLPVAGITVTRDAGRLSFISL